MYWLPLSPAWREQYKLTFSFYSCNEAKHLERGVAHFAATSDIFISVSYSLLNASTGKLSETS